MEHVEAISRKSILKIGAVNGKEESTCRLKMPHVATKSLEWGDGKSVGLLHRFSELGQRAAFGGPKEKRLQYCKIIYLAQRHND